MKFTGSPNEPFKGAFGRHETFALRYGWLTKGVQELNTDLTFGPVNFFSNSLSLFCLLTVADKIGHSLLRRYSVTS